MTFDISKIKAELIGGGARPSLFNIFATFPEDLNEATKSSAERKLEFLCQAASLPGSTLASIPVPYMGRNAYVAGNRSFEPWQITVLNDEDFLIRQAFEAWSKAINSHQGNLRSAGVGSNPESYKGRFVVRQFSKEDDNTPIRKYVMEGVFPLEVAAIELNWGTENEIESFTVNLQIDWWELDQSVE